MRINNSWGFCFPSIAAADQLTCCNQDLSVWIRCSHDARVSIIQTSLSVDGCCCCRMNKHDTNYRSESMRGWQRIHRMEAAEIRDDCEARRLRPRPSERKRSATVKMRRKVSVWLFGFLSSWEASLRLTDSSETKRRNLFCSQDVTSRQRVISTPQD